MSSHDDDDHQEQETRVVVEQNHTPPVLITHHQYLQRKDSFDLESASFSHSSNKVSSALLFFYIQLLYIFIHSLYVPSYIYIYTHRCN